VLGGRSAEALLRLPVRLNGIHLGQPTDLVLDAEGTRAVGLEVRCADAEVRFLPLPAARISDREIEIGSPLLLLEEDSFYRSRSQTLGSLRGVAVDRGQRRLGTLTDVLLADDGKVDALVVQATSGIRRVRLDRNVRVSSEPSGRAADGRGRQP
jgi:sporulation protein YlmC with PRC-barrel domain